jgi:hypothetical protein
MPIRPLQETSKPSMSTYDPLLVQAMCMLLPVVRISAFHFWSETYRTRAVDVPLALVVNGPDV